MLAAPFIVSVGDEGETRVHNLTIFFDGNRAAGKHPKPETYNEDADIHVVSSLLSVISPEKGTYTYICDCCIF